MEISEAMWGNIIDFIKTIIGIVVGAGIAVLIQKRQSVHELKRWRAEYSLPRRFDALANLHSTLVDYYEVLRSYDRYLEPVDPEIKAHLEDRPKLWEYLDGIEAIIRAAKQAFNHARVHSKIYLDDQATLLHVQYAAFVFDDVASRIIHHTRPSNIVLDIEAGPQAFAHKDFQEAYQHATKALSEHLNPAEARNLLKESQQNNGGKQKLR